MITFLYIGIAFIVFTIILCLSRRPLSLENKLIAAFMFFLGLPLLIKLHIERELSIPFAKALLCVKSSPFTYGPFLYLYAKFKIDPKPLFKSKHLLHFLPFILFTAVSFFVYYPDNGSSKIINVNGNSAKLQIVPGDERLASRHETYTSEAIPESMLSLENEIQGHLPPSSEIFDPVLYSFLLLSFCIYSFFILRLLLNHGKNVSEYYSYDSVKLNLKWLRWLTVCFMISYLFAYISRYLGLNKHLPLNLCLLPDVSLLFFIFTFCFFAFRQHAVFQGADKHDPADVKGAKKYVKSSLRKDEEENYANILERFMEKEKPYLNEKLTIADISGELGIPRHYLTQIINESFNKNFYMYINEYRVKMAEQMMTDSSYRDYTFLRIAYESGFNSKTSFNRIFKRISGYTPTEYRKRIDNTVK